jgi:uncharacterized membrane protein
MEIPLIAILHLITGTAAVLAGSIALMSKKGLIVHRLAGVVFLGCMIALSLSGLYLSFTRSIVFTAFLGMLAFYLVSTGWVAVKRRTRSMAQFEKVAMFGILIGGTICAITGFFAPVTSASPQDAPPAEAYYVMAAVAICCGLLDIRQVRRGGVSGKNRIARHLWRMGASMFIAVTIFFLGNSNVLPEFFRDPLLLATPILLVFFATIFWLYRVQITSWRVPVRGQSKTAEI